VEEFGDMQSLCNATQVAASVVGMTVVACGIVSGPRRLDGNIFHFTTWPEDWLKLYISQGYLEKDPVPRWAVVSGTAISWTDLLDTLAPDDPGHEVYRNAANWGFYEGFVTPVRGLDGSLGLVSTGGGKVKLSSKERLILQSVSATAFQRAETIASSSLQSLAPAFASLQMREAQAAERPLVSAKQTLQSEVIRELLSLTSAEWRVARAMYEGESLQGIAAVHKVSINTLRVQLSSIYAKTNTHRQTELVAAIRKAVNFHTLRG
jgi:DNA-binding CsgD family transcriptional regulator